jgi:hypothetical protein
MENGIATNVELRKHFVEKRDSFQYLIDRLDAGETPDQEDQQQLYRDHEETSRQPIRAVEGHVIDSNAHAPLAIEAPPELERAVPGTSMRASDMDPSSGQRKSDGDRQESQTPPEHVRQRDRKQQAGPLSLKQSWLRQEKERRGGDGKSIF